MFFTQQVDALLESQWWVCLLTLSLPRVINFNFLFQSLTRDISYSMENLAIDSLLRWKFIEQSFLTTSLNQFLLERLGGFVLWAWDWKGRAYNLTDWLWWLFRKKSYEIWRVEKNVGTFLKSNYIEYVYIMEY